MLNSSDSQAFERLKEWERNQMRKAERRGELLTGTKVMASRALRPVTKPLAKTFKPVVERIKPLTESEIVTLIQNALQIAVAGAFQMTHDTLKYTYDKKYILKSLKIDTFEQLYEVNADDIEHHIKRATNRSKLYTTFQGMGFGLGGLEATLIDLPLFFAMLARVQQQICSCYGYNPENEFEHAYMLKALSFSDPISTVGKATLLMELNTLKYAIKRHTYKTLSEMGGKYLIPAIAKEYAKKHGIQLTKNKMTQSIPVIGAVFGGFFNYGYISRVVTTTNNLYKTRFLEDKDSLNQVIEV